MLTDLMLYMPCMQLPCRNELRCQWPATFYRAPGIQLTARSSWRRRRRRRRLAPQSAGRVRGERSRGRRKRWRRSQTKTFHDTKAPHIQADVPIHAEASESRSENLGTSANATIRASTRHYARRRA